MRTARACSFVALFSISSVNIACSGVQGWSAVPREIDGQESVCKAESVGRQACKGEAASIWTLGMHGRSRDAHLKPRDPLLAITCAFHEIEKHCCTSTQPKVDSPAVSVGGVCEHGRLCRDGRAQTRAYARAQRRASTNGRVRVRVRAPRHTWGIGPIVEHTQRPLAKIKAGTKLNSRRRAREQGSSRAGRFPKLDPWQTLRV